MFVTRIYRDMSVVKWMFFFEVFTNHVPRILRSVLGKITIDQFYFWDAYDVSLWESYLSQKVCYIETRLQQGNVRGYFENKRNDKRFEWRLFIIFLNEHLLEAVVRRWSAKRYSYNFTKFTTKNLCLWPVTLFKKRLCYRCLNVVKL